MLEIIPTILPKNYDNLKNEIALVRGLVPVVQIDICDGVFTSSKTWPFTSGATGDYHFQKILNEEEGMPFWEDIDFELDLLVADAVSNFDIYTKLGARRMIFHLEAVEKEFVKIEPSQTSQNEFRNFLEGIDNYVRDTLEIGIAINPSTPLERIFPLISNINFVQFMGNDKLGYHGVELNENIYERIKIFKEKYPDMPIAVDIGVNEDTAPKLVEAGATKLAIGSAILNADDIIGKVEEFRNL